MTPSDGLLWLASNTDDVGSLAKLAHKGLRSANGARWSSTAACRPTTRRSRPSRAIATSRFVCCGSRRPYVRSLHAHSARGCGRGSTGGTGLSGSGRVVEAALQRRAHATRARGDPARGSARGRAYALGAAAALGREVGCAAAADDQCTCRGSEGQAGVSRCARTQTLPRARGWLLRVEARPQRAKVQAATDVHPQRAAPHDRIRGPVGAFAQRRRRAAFVHDHHRPAERAGEADPRPDADRPRPGRLRSVARSRG